MIRSKVGRFKATSICIDIFFRYYNKHVNFSDCTSYKFVEGCEHLNFEFCGEVYSFVLYRRQCLEEITVFLDGDTFDRYVYYEYLNSFYKLT